jgi:hypothetical protein
MASYKRRLFYNFDLSMNSKRLITVLLVLAVLATMAFSQSELGRLLPEIEAVIEQGKNNIWSEIEPDEPLWNFPPWLGSFFISEYYFELKGISPFI